MNPQPIEDIVSGTLDALAEVGFTERSLASHRFPLQKILRIHEAHGSHFYNPMLIERFLSEITEKCQTKAAEQRYYYKRLLKTVGYLIAYYEKGQITVTASYTVESGLNTHYQRILLSINSNTEWNEATRRRMRYTAMPYLKWLQAEGCNSLRQLTDTLLRKYLMDISGRMTAHSIDTIRRGLKMFHLYAFEIGMTECSYQDVLSFTVPPEYHIQKPAQQDEVAKVLSIIDRNTPKGKRDYAIILLGAVLGLRSIDIVNLRRNEINWATGEIVLQQTKTGKWLALPLTADIGIALQDYILNARPKSNEPYVFLRMRAPIMRIGKIVPYTVLNTYAEKAGLSRMQFHGLRRMVGTNLVVEGIPVTTVAQVLGHSSIEPTKQYISLDSPRLKECALDFSGLPPYGGERP